ncbi:hypothetical protein G7046_g5265 [Stylonectria norvegica]|nr:hypothetical protein G7046_g5265 [Stylonectria norvegica]
MGALLTGFILGFIGLALYAWRLDVVMRTTPAEAQKHLPPINLTADAVRATYDRVAKRGIDWNANLPPCLERRYIVVGGSGMLGPFSASSEATSSSSYSQMARPRAQSASSTCARRRTRSFFSSQA